MGRYARQRAAVQMERDGIRSVFSRGGCGHVEDHGEVRIECKNRHRYHVQGVGKLCCTHALLYKGRGAQA